MLTMTTSFQPERQQIADNDRISGSSACQQDMNEKQKWQQTLST